MLGFLLGYIVKLFTGVTGTRSVLRMGWMGVLSRPLSMKFGNRES